MTEQRGRRRRVRSALAPHLTRGNAVLALVSCAILVMVVLTQLARPATEFDSNAFAPSFKVTGTIGERVDLRGGTITLSDLRLARSLQPASGTEDEEPLETPGVWVLVDYQFVGARKSESLQPKLVTIDHRTYRPSNRPGSATTTSVLGEPGFPDTGTFAFEVPRNALSGSSVTIGADSPFGDALWDTKAVISLDIGDDEATRLVRRAPAKLELGR